MIDNSLLIEPFLPSSDDGDTFLYTEMLDRGKQKGNNGHRLVKTFYHRSLDEFREQMPVIRQLCDLARVRAYIRLAPRSWSKVGRHFCQLVVSTAMCENWNGMKSLYNRACGMTGPTKKLWLWDVDLISERSEGLATWLNQHAAPLGGCGGPPLLRARIPSKKGEHFITDPFDLRRLPDDLCGVDISLHKDNPTNLYIPDGAD